MSKYSQAPIWRWSLARFPPVIRSISLRGTSGLVWGENCLSAKHQFGEEKTNWLESELRKLLAIPLQILSTKRQRQRHTPTSPPLRPLSKCFCISSIADKVIIESWRKRKRSQHSKGEAAEQIDPPRNWSPNSTDLYFWYSFCNLLSSYDIATLSKWVLDTWNLPE